MERLGHDDCELGQSQKFRYDTSFAQQIAHGRRGILPSKTANHELEYSFATRGTEVHPDPYSDQDSPALLRIRHEITDIGRRHDWRHAGPVFWGVD